MTADAADALLAFVDRIDSQVRSEALIREGLAPLMRELNAVRGLPDDDPRRQAALGEYGRLPELVQQCNSEDAEGQGAAAHRPDRRGLRVRVIHPQVVADDGAPPLVVLRPTPPSPPQAERWGLRRSRAASIGGRPREGVRGGGDGPRDSNPYVAPASHRVTAVGGSPPTDTVLPFTPPECDPDRQRFHCPVQDAASGQQCQAQGHVVLGA